MFPHPDTIEGVTDHQRAGLAAATRGTVGCLSGGPGCGKTHSTAALIDATLRQKQMLDALAGKEEQPENDFVDRLARSAARQFGLKYKDLSIALCAPTGKAAIRLTEAIHSHARRFNCPELTSLHATTIHQLLVPQRNGHDGEGWGFYHDQANPLPFDVVIVEEASMVDTDLAAHLLCACADGTHLLFVGDPYQLAPVGHGKPFADMIESGVIPAGELTELHRYAGRIAHVCDAIKRGLPWQPSARIDLDAESPENLRHIEKRRPHEVLATLQDVVERVRDRGWDPVIDMQVICPLNENGPLSRENLNRVLQHLLNPGGEMFESSKGYRVGDKVSCTRNQWFELWNEDDLQRPARRRGDPPQQVYIANGDIGTVVSLGEKAMLIQFSDSRRVKVPKHTWETITLAYAISGHKSQGSQWKVAVNIIDDSPAAERVCSREYVYTTTSRASDLCITIGQMRVLQRHCRKVGTQRRTTRLSEMLKERMGMRV